VVLLGLLRWRECQPGFGYAIVFLNRYPAAIQPFRCQHN
jgi:hypothetical protein